MIRDNGEEETVEGIVDKGVIRDDSVRLVSDDLIDIGLNKDIVIRIEDEQDEEDNDGEENTNGTETHTEIATFFRPGIVHHIGFGA